MKKEKEEKDKLLEEIEYAYFEIEKNFKDYLLK